MEYLKGSTLATYLRHLHQRKKRIPPDQVARLLNEISLALDYAHKQDVIHRDIKPGNIILHNKTEDITVDKPLTDDVEAIITDFGLVRIMNTASQTATGMVSGTPAYMSPEQARGDQTDQRTDIYSLGVVLYEMLAGRVPFEADSTLTVLHMQIHTTPPPIAGIPEKVQQVIDRALVKNPDDRYQTSRELAMDYYRSIGMSAQAATIQEYDPISVTPIDASVPAMIKQATEAESQSKPELTPKPARSRIWIGAGLISLVCTTLLAIGGYRLLSAGAILPNSTATLSPEIPNTGISPLPSEPPSLPDAARMVKVNAGNYQVGRDPSDNYHIAVQSMNLNEFWIDQYQTTNAEYEQYLTTTGAPTPIVWPGEPNHPVRGVTWDQALAYCGWINKRLPDEAEWEAAGRGPGLNPQLYPWGDDPTDGGNALQLPNQNTYEIGSQSFNVSPLQVYDMVGNVWEWVGEPYDNLSPEIKVLRGGRYSNAVDLAYRLSVPPDNTTTVQYAGFRCAASQVR